MKVLLVLIAIAAGIGSALESGSNSTMQKILSSPLWTVTLVAIVSLALSLGLALGWGGPMPAGSQLARAPWWAWLGGIFGVLFLFATVYVSPKLGAGIFVALIVTSSTLMSLVMDNYGLLGFEVHPAGVGRIVGGLLMIAGVACIAAF